MSDRSYSPQVIEMTTEVSSQDRATLQPNDKTLEERQARLIRRRETLLREIEVRKLEEEVRILERQATAEPTTRARPREELIPDDASG